MSTTPGGLTREVVVHITTSHAFLFAAFGRDVTVRPPCAPPRRPAACPALLDRPRLVGRLLRLGLGLVVEVIRERREQALHVVVAGPAGQYCETGNQPPHLLSSYWQPVSCAWPFEGTRQACFILNLAKVIEFRNFLW